MLDSIDARQEDRQRIERQTEEYLANGGEIEAYVTNEAEVKAELRAKYSEQLRRFKKR